MSDNYGIRYFIDGEYRYSVYATATEAYDGYKRIMQQIDYRPYYQRCPERTTINHNGKDISLDSLFCMTIADMLP